MNRSKHMFAVILTMVLAISMVAGAVSVNAAAKPTKLYLKSTTKTVDIGGKATVSVKSVKPAKASKSVTWSSSNKKVATVTSKGVVTGKKAGNVTIKATSKYNKKVKAVFKITVKQLKPTKVTLNKTKATVKLGSTLTLNATLSPVGVKNNGITWSSSNADIAKVSSTGVVTAVCDGEATITAKTKEGGKIARCVVTVPANFTTAKALYSKLGDDKTVLLDARKVADYKTAHIPTAISASCDSIVSGEETTAEDGNADENIKAVVEKYGKDKRYEVIGYTGKAYADAAVANLKGNGVGAVNISVLRDDNGTQSEEGGMKAWNDCYADYVVKSYTSAAGYDFSNGITPDQLKGDIAGNKKYTLIDLRNEDEYDAGHVPGAMCAPQKDLDADAAEANLKALTDKTSNAMYVLLAYTDNSVVDQAYEAMTTKLGVPAEKCIVLEGGYEAWDGDRVIGCHYTNAAALYSNLTDYVVVDARKTADYKAAHIPTAISASCEEAVSGDTTDGNTEDNIGAVVVKNGETVDTDTKYAVIGYSGNEYSIAATAELMKQGVPSKNILTLGGDDNAVSSEGGMKAWNRKYSKYTVKTYTTSDKKYTFNDVVTISQLKGDAYGSKKYVILDLRASAEYGVRSMPGAVNAPQKDVTDAEAEESLKQAVDSNSDAIYVLLGYTGGSYADKALKTMTDRLGVPAGRCIVAEGGYDAWSPIAPMEGKYIVNTSYVKSVMGSSNVVLVDARGINSKTRTLKGAISMTWPQISKTPQGGSKLAIGQEGYACTLDPGALSNKLGSFGINPNKEIILFTDIKSGWGEDGRIAWQLVTAGYTDVKIVDGGIEAITAAKLPMQTGPSAPKKCTVTVTSNSKDRNIDTKELKNNMSSIKIIDTRTLEEYSGTKTMYNAAKNGHIPGATLMAFTTFFRSDATVKSPDTIEKMMTDAGFSKDDQIVLYCTGGIRSGYLQLILEMCGYKNVKNYDESFWRWAALYNTELK